MQGMKELVYDRDGVRDKEPDHSMFTTLALREDDGIRVALGTLENKIHTPGTKILQLMSEFCSTRNLLEVVLSGLDKAAFDRYMRAVKNEWTTDTDIARFRAAPGGLLLQRLRRYFDDIASILPDDGRDAKMHIANIDRIDAALDNLSPALAEALRSGSCTQLTLDESLLVEFGLDYPVTVREMRKAAERFIKEQIKLLECLLRLLRDPTLSHTVRDYYTQASSIVTQPKEQDRRCENMPYHVLSGKKAALVVDTLDGHGDRRILMSSRAIRNLRQAHFKPKFYSMVMAALQSLSKSHGDAGCTEVLATFSNSQSGNSQVSSSQICARRVSPTHSIVYCSDAVPSLRHEGQESALRIFGIYHDSVLHDPYWTQAAAQVQLERASNVSAGVTQERTSEDNEDNLRKMLILDKFVDLCKNTVEGIRTGSEIMQAFELSSREQELVDYDGSCYVVGRSGTGKTTVMLTKMLAMECTWLRYSDMGNKPRQLFVTRSPYLATKVAETFFPMLATHAPHTITDTETRVHRRVLVDTDEESRHKIQRFGYLQDEDFPQFLSFDRLCSMLEAELEIPSRAVLSFEEFLSVYYKTFPHDLVRNFDASILFGEFIGIIKGSENSLQAVNGCLSREDYVSRRRSLNLTSSSQRHAVYDLFELYQRRKRPTGRVDIADRTQAILRALGNKQSRVLHTVDFLFVDEAQDNLLIDTRLLRLLCKNPRGIFWAGDTAQTIFNGSTFTFNELKAFMYRTEEEISISQSPSARDAPTFFTLTRNFRSQNGILRCAQVVLDLVAHHWPASIDTVLNDEGYNGGKKPLFLNFLDSSEESGGSLIHHLISKASGSAEFGADQCILVRDNATRIALRKFLGDTRSGETAQILTLYESKGLEYNDVIIYEFFKGSTHTDWRYLKTNSTRDGVAERTILCHELKRLYVACTRARHTLWIVDSSEQAEAMQLLWLSGDAIQAWKVVPDLTAFASASKQEKWAGKANEYFGRGFYELALRAYRNADLFHEAKVAEAYLLRQAAEHCDAAATSRERRKAYETAAEAFSKVAPGASADEALTYHRIAGECFLEIPDEGRAAEAFMLSHEYTMAVRIYRRIGNFDRIAGILRNHSHEVERITEERIRYAARLFFLLSKNLQGTESVFIDDEEASAFAIKHGLSGVNMLLLERMGNYTEAARHRLRANQPTAAKGLLERCLTLPKHHEETLELLLQDLVTACWHCVSVGSNRNPPSDEKTRSLLALTSRWVQEGVVSEILPHNELSMFHAVQLKDKAWLRLLADRLHRMDGGEAAAYVCLTHSLPLVNPPASLQDGLLRLRRFLPLFSLLGRFRSEPNPCFSIPLQKALGFRRVNFNTYRLLSTSPILQHIQNRLVHKPKAGSEGEQLLPAGLLKGYIADFLAETSSCRAVSIVSNFRPMLAVKKGDRPLLQETLEAIFGMVHILDSVRDLAISNDLATQKRYLLKDLFVVLTSPAYNAQRQYSLSSIVDAIPGGNASARLVQSWLQESMALLRPGQSGFFRDLIRTSLSSSTLAVTVATASFELVPRTRESDQTVKLHDECLDMCSGYKPWSSRAYISLLSYVVSHKMQVDIEACFTMVDYISGKLSVEWLVSITGNTLGAVFLSRGPLLAYGINAGQSTPERTFQSSLLLQCAHWFILSVASLLYAVLGIKPDGAVRQEFLLYRNRPLKLADDLRCIYAARACEALIILGHNINDPALRKSILASTMSLRSCFKNVPKSLTRYAAVDSWKELVDSLPTRGHILEVTRAFSPNKSPIIEYKVYEARFPLGDRTSVSSGRLPASVTSARQQPLGALHAATNAFRQARIMPSIARAVAEPSQKEYTANLARVESISRAFEHDIHQQRRLFATLRLQQFCRRLHALRQPVAHPPLLFLTNSIYQECLREADSIQWLRPRYRMLYLGPLPHALACLDAIATEFDSMKKAAVNRLKQGKHQDLEQLGDEVLEINGLLETARDLRQSKLGPRAVTYRQGLWQDFLQYIREIRDLIAKLPSSVGTEIRDEWEIVERGILKRGKHELGWIF